MKLVYCFSYFITCGKTWNTILNKYFCTFYFCLNVLIQMECFNLHVYVFCFGIEIGTENRGFPLVSVPNTEMWIPWQHYMQLGVLKWYLWNSMSQLWKRAAILKQDAIVRYWVTIIRYGVAVMRKKRGCNWGKVTIVRNKAAILKYFFTLRLP